jgi:transcriptional regulator with GAF, ATPase, and Fis domain
MGSVFQAREEPEGIELTVKQLRLDAPELLESFRGEFALLSRVSAPHLLRVVDFGSERLRGEPHHYYVAERVHGVSLGERTQRTAGADLLRALGDAVLGLSALHEAGIRHGDFTPANVLVDRSGGGVLIDLGCARPFGVTLHLAGTEGYLAPELLEGRPGDARSDLYGVGRTLESLFAGGARPPAAVERLMERLLRPDPAARPLDCAEVLAALGRKARPFGTSWTPARLLGREAEVARFEGWLSTLLSGDSGPRVFGLWGGAGMGLSRLLRELTWRAQVRLSVLRGHTEQPVGRLLATALGLSEVVSTRRGVLAAVSVLAERAEPLLLVVEDAERLPSEEQELLVSLVRSLGARGNLALLVSSRVAFAGDGVLRLECGALPAAAVQSWTLPLLTEKRARELGRQSAGSPRRIEQLLAEHFGVLPETTAAEPEKSRKASLGELSAAERETLALIYSQTGEVFAHSLGLNWSELDPLLERRLIERDGEELRLSGAARDALARGALSAAELAKAHLLAAGWFALQEAERGGGARAARVIHHLVRGGDVTRAEALLSAESAALRGGTRQVGKLLLPLVDASQQAQVLLELAGLFLELGQPRAAVRAAARAARYGKGPELRRRAALLASDGLTRLGRPARAELLLGGLWAAGGQAVSGPDGAEVLQRLARARLSRGDYAGARDTAERALEEAPAALVAGLTHETLGVACAYLGDAERAQNELNQALSLLAEQARPRDRSRIQSHRAMVAFRAGRVEPALADYAGALALAEEHDLDDLIATGLLNLGTAEQQAGLWGEALRHYERGVTFASAASRTSTELTLEFNLANLHAEIGAFERAEEALSRLELKSAAAKLAHFTPGIALIRAEIRLARAEPDEAEQELLGAERLLQGRAQPRELFEVRLRRIDVELLRDEPREAERKLKALASSQPDDAAADLSVGLELARARVDAALGRTNALERLESARVRAQREGLLALEATLETELSQAAQRLGSVDDARARTERARRLWDRIGQGLPVGLTSLFWRHARRAPLVEPSRSFATTAETGTAGGHEAEAYRRLLSLNRRLNSSLSLDRVLEYAVQAALDLTEAERAFLLLTRAAAGEGAGLSAEVAVARSTDPALPEGEGPSQSIVRRTLEREEPILTTDAQGDPRFAGQGSVHALRLKSVLSVPVLSPSGVLGVLYVDCRVQRGRFSEAERALLSAFADQLALAISNARLHQELERKGAELTRQKHAIEQLSRGQAREIERLKREVQTQRQNLELRYDYSQIVGRGPAMRAVLERLDRVIDSEASVLILGESGTGKELVARAIHWNGPRKSGPFLGLNCAALPESLLESELFGHVRGAFTGADRDKQGLLQAAAGGTLFLDELGELSPATQAKLLRVLQEREVRPLGSEKSVPIDVRLLAATHRELDRAMAEGKFREDLYYRIAVVTVQLPPLRERPEDLPVLCEKILQRLGQDAGKKPPELGQDALRRLSAHPFPGNVRELENVLTRAFVLAPGSKLRAEDLDLGGRRAPAPRARSRRDFEADERDRILAALRAARWNVSVVSRTLGIPRNTLYRKLQRYGLERAV